MSTVNSYRPVGVPTPSLDDLASRVGHFEVTEKPALTSKMLDAAFRGSIDGEPVTVHFDSGGWVDDQTRLAPGFYLQRGHNPDAFEEGRPLPMQRSHPSSPSQAEEFLQALKASRRPSVHTYLEGLKNQFQNESDFPVVF